MICWWFNDCSFSFNKRQKGKRCKMYAIKKLQKQDCCWSFDNSWHLLLFRWFYLLYPAVAGNVTCFECSKRFFFWWSIVVSWPPCFCLEFQIHEFFMTAHSWVTSQNISNQIFVKEKRIPPWRRYLVRVPAASAPKMSHGWSIFGKSFYRKAR